MTTMINFAEAVYNITSACLNGGVEHAECGSMEVTAVEDHCVLAIGGYKVATVGGLSLSINDKMRADANPALIDAMKRAISDRKEKLKTVFDEFIEDQCGDDAEFKAMFAMAA